jgi:hypothetical protein
LENSLIISLCELSLIEFSISVYAPKKGQRGVDDEIYSMKSLSAFVWTSIQKLVMCVFENISIYSFDA